MPTLRMSFSGLCTFVFDPPLDPSIFEESPAGDANLKKATVLLQRLTRARALANQVNLRSEVLDQHFPLLEFNRKDWQPKSTRKADFHCFPDAEGEMTKGVCLLKGEELTIVSDRPSDSSLAFSRLKPKDPANPVLGLDEETSLFWMATLEDALPGRAMLNPRLLDTPAGSNQPILAKVQFDQGFLKTRELTDLPFNLGPSGPNSSFPRRVAIAFDLEVPFKEEVTVNMLSLNSDVPRRLVLKSQKDVEVGIANMEIDRYIGIDPTTGPHVAADFEVYFDLLQRPIAQDQSRPFLQLAARGGSSGQGGVSSCAPAHGTPGTPGG